MPGDLEQLGLSLEELEAEQAVPLPDREAMTLVSPSLLPYHPPPLPVTEDPAPVADLLPPETA